MFWKKKEKKHNCQKDDNFVIEDSGVFVHENQISGYWQSKTCKICGRNWLGSSGIGLSMSLTKKMKKEIIERINK